MLKMIVTVLSVYFLLENMVTVTTFCHLNVKASFLQHIKIMIPTSMSPCLTKHHAMKT